MEFCTLKNGKPQRLAVETPAFTLQTQVLVAGLGTAGSLAAITAAEQGVQVLGVEAQSCMGGLGTLGCVWDYFFGSPGGRFEKNVTQTQQLGHNLFTPCSDLIDERGSRYINGAAKSAVLFKNAEEAGCRLLFETVITGVYLQEGRVAGVQALGENGLFNIAANALVDATGGAAVARLCGVKTQLGRQSDGQCPLCSKTTIVARNGVTRCSWGLYRGYAGKSVLEKSNLLLRAGSEGPCLQPVYSEAERPVLEGTVLGERESYRIRGRQTVTLQGLIQGEQPQKPVFYAFSVIDSVQEDIAKADPGLQLWRMVCRLHSTGIFVGIPLEALLPQGVEGLIVAGKGMALDEILAGCVRMKKDIEKSGEAAGALAALAVLQNCTPALVNYQALKKLLQSSGCLKQPEYTGLCSTQNGMDRAPVLPPKTKAQLARLLQSEHYGVAVFYKICGRLSVEKAAVLPWLKSSSNALQLHAALAAGAWGFTEAETNLLTLAQSVEDPLPAGADKSNRSAAVFLLGQLKSKAAVPILQQILSQTAAVAEREFTALNQGEKYFWNLNHLAQNALKSILA